MSYSLGVNINRSPTLPQYVQGRLGQRPAVKYLYRSGMANILCVLMH